MHLLLDYFETGYWKIFYGVDSFEDGGIFTTLLVPGVNNLAYRQSQNHDAEYRGYLNEEPNLILHNHAPFQMTVGLLPLFYPLVGKISQRARTQSR